MCLGASLGAYLATGSCVAQTHDGLFEGHPSIQEPSVCEWLGIPYAEPPVGHLRFAAPIEVDTSISNTSYLADEYVGQPFFFFSFFLLAVSFLSSFF